MPNNTATKTTQVKTQADIYVTKSDSPDPYLAVNNLTYTLGVHNGGPSVALGVILTDPIPAGPCLHDALPICTYNGITNTVTWNLGTITAGGLSSVSLVVKVDSSRTT